MPQESTPRYLAGRTRPTFPRRAVVTAGMPYGNKDLHFGHVGGVFVHADAFARFLRDRIGRDNVIFVSGTDCYGSPIVQDYQQKLASGEFSGSLQEFVEGNHRRQRETLDAYSISPNLFAASSIEPYKGIHEQLGANILKTLHANGHVGKLTTPQFFDPEAGIYLTGRQVVGRCPISGCQSEKAYADECSLGHQFDPKDLIAPRSALTGKTPIMRDVTNWYIPMQDYKDKLLPWYQQLLATGLWREASVRMLLEYFEPPTIHVKLEDMEAVAKLAAQLPPHRQAEGQAKSMKLVFERLEDSEKARAVLAAAAIRYRTGKTLVPFRLTGNLEWGLRAPELDGLGGLTFWVWPESLWAPISFTAACLEKSGAGRDSWCDWWSSPEARVFQFIGEDNVYFYGLAEIVMFLGMQGRDFSLDAPDGQLQMPIIIANRHLLFLDKKASSSGAVKPPMAKDLLNYYTSDQLRAHFLGMGLATRNARFQPKPLNPKAPAGASDPVLKDGNLLSNAFNRAVRSCFYTVGKHYGCKIPVGEISPDVAERCELAVLDFEEAFARQEFHTAMSAIERLIHDINSRWERNNPYYDDCPPDLRRQTLIDAFHMVRTAIVLAHPIAPVGTEKVRDYLRLDERLWSWEHIFEPLYAFMDAPADHQVKELAPKVDFFDKHPSQIR